MAVVINDFEVVSAEPRQERPTQSAALEETDKAALEHEVARMIEHQLERFARVWAH